MNNEKLIILTEPSIFSDKEKIYIRVREKEGRLYSDEILQKLPYIDKSHHLYSEWKYRSVRFNKFRNYLSGKNKSLIMLDLGCGNGWMANSLCKIKNSNVTAIDLNLTELEQASRVFGENANLQFCYGDIFSISLPFQKFDLIYCASAIQYFSDLKILINCLINLLTADGEIHILDSPVYNESEVKNAYNRSLEYYKSIGIEEMISYYHHHSWSELNEFSFVNLNNTPLEKIKSKLSKNLFPFFPWIKIKKT